MLPLQATVVVGNLGLAGAHLRVVDAADVGRRAGLASRRRGLARGALQEALLGLVWREQGV